jgi:hypothetical protein
MLKEFDVIEIELGHFVNATFEWCAVYGGNCKQVVTRGVKINGNLSHLVGRYVVYKTAMNGGGEGSGPGDRYTDGHHVYCEKLDDPCIKIDFYQSGCFDTSLSELKPVGTAKRVWVVDSLDANKADDLLPSVACLDQ